MRGFDRENNDCQTTHFLFIAIFFFNLNRSTILIAKEVNVIVAPEMIKV